MKTEKILNLWKDKKCQVMVRGNFSDEVMNRISQYEQKKSRPLFDVQRFLEFVSAHQFAKVSLVTAGAAAGFVRLLFLILVILSKGLING